MVPPGLVTGHLVLLNMIIITLLSDVPGTLSPSHTALASRSTLFFGNCPPLPTMCLDIF